MLAEVILKAAQFEKEGKSKWKERPSGAALNAPDNPHKCLRADVFHHMGVPRQELADRAEHVFTDSSFHEDLTADWIRKTVYRLHSVNMPIDIMEMDWVPPPPKGLSPYMRKCLMCGEMVPYNVLHGHIDGIITDPLMVDRHYEHKALSTYSVKDMWASKRLPAGYLAQCHLYAKGLNLIVPEITETILLIKDKNISGYIDYIIEHDFKRDSFLIKGMTNHNGERVELNHKEENVLARITDYWRRVRECAKQKLLPVRSFQQGDWQCDYCGWNDECWRGYTEEVKKRQDIVLPNEIFLPKLERYIELRDYDKEKKALAKELKFLLESYGLRGGDVYLMDKVRGLVGGISVMLKVSKSNRVNMSKIPEEVVDAARESSETVALDVRVIKPSQVEKRKEEKMKKYLEVTDEAKLEAGLTGKRIVEL